MLENSGVRLFYLSSSALSFIWWSNSRSLLNSDLDFGVASKDGKIGCVNALSVDIQETLICGPRRHMIQEKIAEMNAQALFGSYVELFKHVTDNTRKRLME